MKKPDLPDEEALRSRIRKRLQEREQQRSKHRDFQQQRHDQATREEEYRRIQQEEESAFYANRPDLIEYINELDEIEYCTREEIRAREGYFNYEEKVENTEREKSKVLLKLFLLVLLLGAAVVQIFIYIQADFGEIAVYANIKGARILLDGEQVGEVTDVVLRQIAPGSHLLQLEKTGYLMQSGTVLEVEVRKNRLTSITVEMIPAVLQ